MHSANIGLIGGTGLESLIEATGQFRIRTPYGSSPSISTGSLGGKTVAFLPRHGAKHEIPPHRVNYRAVIWSLNKIGVKRIISTNAVGAINQRYKPGDLVIPSDIIDFTRSRTTTFYDKGQAVHIDVTDPYCSELKALLSASIQQIGCDAWRGSVLAVTEGPRFETPAEIRMMKGIGCDVVGMTGSPEIFLARELEMCYASICFVSNMAAGIQSRLTIGEVVRMGRKTMPVIRQVVERTIVSIPEQRKCLCSKALEQTRT